MFALSVSTQFDWRLALIDIDGSIAHAGALHAAGLLSDDADRRGDGVGALQDLYDVASGRV